MVAFPEMRLSTGNRAYFNDIDFMIRKYDDTWRPLKQINLTHLGPAEGTRSSGALSKHALSTAIVVEGRHHEELQKA